MGAIFLISVLTLSIFVFEFFFIDRDIYERDFDSNCIYTEVKINVLFTKCSFHYYAGVGGTKFEK